MASSITLPTIQGSIHKTHFLGQNFLHSRNQKQSFPVPKQSSKLNSKPCAKFDLFEILGGRGLCNGEQGLKQELQKNIAQEASALAAKEEEEEESSSSTPTSTVNIEENAFEKELLGLTGGFPGGEKGLKKFIQENPPPKRPPPTKSGNTSLLATSKKPKAPELPVLMPGMIALVKNPNNPFYMYCGIVQRITDGKAGVLFEGGNWDRLVTFRLDELERRDKGPPMKNPKSVILEAMLEKGSE